MKAGNQSTESSKCSLFTSLVIERSLPIKMCPCLQCCQGFKEKQNIELEVDPDPLDPKGVAFSPTFSSWVFVDNIIYFTE